MSLPAVGQEKTQEHFAARVARGLRIYVATPRLRGLLAINLLVAAAGAMVTVNTVVVARGMLGLSNADVAVAMAAFDAGSMISAAARNSNGVDRLLVLERNLGHGGGSVKATWESGRTSVCRDTSQSVRADSCHLGQCRLRQVSYAQRTNPQSE